MARLCRPSASWSKPTESVARSLREALRELASKGLVEARPRYRPTVREPSFDTAFETVENVVARLLTKPDGVKSLFDTSVMVEAALVRRAATEAGKDDIAALKDALERNEAAIHDSERFYQTDVGFHAVFYRVPRNPVLPAIHRAYTTRLSPQWSLMSRLPDMNRTNFEAHKAIYDAVLLRDPDAAETALLDHLADAWNQVRRTFETT